MTHSRWVIQSNDALYRIYANDKSHIVCFKTFDEAEEFKKKILCHFKLQDVYTMKSKKEMHLMVHTIRTTVPNKSFIAKAKCIEIDNTNTPHVIMNYSTLINFLHIRNYELLSSEGQYLDYDDALRESKFIYKKPYLLSVQGIML